MKRWLVALFALAAAIVMYKATISVTAGGPEISYITDPLSRDPSEIVSASGNVISYTTKVNGAYSNPQMVCFNWLLHRQVANFTITVYIRTNTTGTISIYPTIGAAMKSPYALYSNPETGGRYIFYRGDVYEMTTYCDGNNNLRVAFYSVDPVTLARTTKLADAYFSTSPDSGGSFGCSGYGKFYYVVNIPMRATTISLLPDTTYNVAFSISYQQLGNVVNTQALGVRLCIGADWVPDTLPALLTMSVVIDYTFR